MSKRSDGFKVEESQRQSWLSIAAVWAGGMICVPSLMIGGVLVGGGLSMAEIVLSILIGYGLICAYMIFIGMQACDTGLPVAVMASGALGEKGARYIISALLAIACIGWFGIQSATCGSAFARMICSMLGMKASPAFISASSIIWGLIMLATACFGFKGLKWLNYIAVPLLVIVCLYGLIAGIVTNDGGAVIAGYNPGKSSGMVFGISMVVASFALGGVISADYCRFAKSRGDVVKSSVVGVLPAGLFMLITGALMSIVTGRSDISAILASLGVPFIGLVALVLGGRSRQEGKLPYPLWIFMDRRRFLCRGRAGRMHHGRHVRKLPGPGQGAAVLECSVLRRSGQRHRDFARAVRDHRKAGSVRRNKSSCVKER